jgi:predicted nucleotidyltransferase
MFTGESLTKYISDYVMACNQQGVYFNKVILFGSYAKNNARQWSDVDLALVSDSFTGMILDDFDKISSANIRFVDIEPHLFSTKYFEKGDPFIEEIIRTGKEIKIA